MKVLHIAPFEEPVPPIRYGGTELVVYNIIEEQVKMGHEVYLIASGDSKTSGKLIPILPRSIRIAYSPHEIDKWREFMKIFQIPKIIRLINEVKPDIVHNHFAWRFVQFHDFINSPIYNTMHGNLSSEKEIYTYGYYKDQNYISISNNQREAMQDLNWVGTVYNGIQVEKFEVGERERDDYFAFLGRTSPEKGLKEICQLISKTDYKLKIAAKVDTVDVKYFENEVKPFIDGKKIEFVGEVDHAGKVELLKNAKGLLAWLNWEEPFGLFVVEAMACGTPVIINKRGSMPELIVDGKTGFLVDSLEEMKSKLSETYKIKAEDCRTHVEKNFSSRKMAEDYIKLAEEIIHK